jgi:hypothetical protein
VDQNDRLVAILTRGRKIDEGDPRSLRLKKFHAPSSGAGNVPMARAKRQWRACNP